MMAVTHNSVGTQRSIVPPQAIQHALGLHIYQPTNNLRYLLQEDEGELRNILLCYERIARYTHKYADVARLHVALSPVLLEQLREPQFIEDCRHLADIPSILEGLRSAAGIEFLGTGYRHAPLPLVPPQDWDEQLRSERLTMEAEFGRMLKGYWPPASLVHPGYGPCPGAGRLRVRAVAEHGIGDAGRRAGRPLPLLSTLLSGCLHQCGTV